MAAEWRPSGGKISAGCRPTCVSIDVGRYVDRVSADISAAYRSIYRPTYRPRVSTDTRSTDVLSTHDPKNEGCYVSN